MEIPVEITFRDIEPSRAIEARIYEHASKLTKFHGRVSGCRVIVEAPHKHHQKGKVYHVTVELSVPGARTLVVSRDSERNHAHEDVYVAIRDAFDAARRQLQDASRIQRGSVKTHEGPEASEESELE